MVCVLARLKPRPLALGDMCVSCGIALHFATLYLFAYILSVSTNCYSGIARLPIMPVEPCYEPVGALCRLKRGKAKGSLAKQQDRAVKARVVAGLTIGAAIIAETSILSASRRLPRQTEMTNFYTRLLLSLFIYSCMTYYDIITLALVALPCYIIYRKGRER